MIHLILCGGSGTRLWPLSRKTMPKQFVNITDDKSLFQHTALRSRELASSWYIITNESHYFLAGDQMEEINFKNARYLLEPVGRNTAPAIALAALDMHPEDILLVTPSDHLIGDVESYKQAVRKAEQFAREGYLVTFGIKPLSPETGYGYIEADGNLVKSFREKPDRATADKYIQSGSYFWNSGIFCFQAGTYLDELKKYTPEIYEASVKAHAQAVKSDNVVRIKSDDMLDIPEESIDYAVMERSEKIRIVPVDMQWNDLGSFESVHEVLDRDENGNTVNKNYIPFDSKNNLVISEDRMVSTIGVDDLLIIDTRDALMIAKSGSGQRVKDVVNRLKEMGSDLPDYHVTTHRPWGTYTILEESSGYKIKRIVVKPGKRLSLQKHFHRSEHWVVVNGTAVVRVGEEEKLVRTNESIYIPIGDVHRLHNPGNVDLVLIEVQVGEYLGEDDIVRIEDDFKRE